MSAPRPCETDPFHPPSSVPASYTNINICIYTTVFQSFLPYGIFGLCMVHNYACAPPEHFVQVSEQFRDLLTSADVLVRNS